MNGTKQTNSRPANSYPTIAAIGVLVYVFASITHEGLGHGGAFLILFSAAAATLMGTCWIVWAPWAPAVLRGSGIKRMSTPQVVLRNIALVLLAAAAAVFCIWKLGAGVALKF